MNKFLTTLLLYCLTITSVMAGLPPTTLSGQSAATKPTTFNFKTPANQATNTGGINSLIETDSENLLVNPGFEHSTVSTGWTLGTSNTLTGTTTSANLYGASTQAGALTTSATVAFDLHQYITPVSGAAGTQGEVTWMINVPSGITDGQICSVVNSVEQNCISVVNNGVYREYTIPFIFGTAGQNAGIKFKTTATYASGTQTVYVEKARVRSGISLTNITVDTDWIAYTPTSPNSSFGTLSSTNCYYRRIGADGFIRCTYTASACNASEARISIPFTTVSTLPTLSITGVYAQTTSDTGGSQQLLMEPSVSYLTFGYNGAGSLTKRNANNLGSCGTFSISSGPIPVSGWSSNTYNFSASGLNYDWTDYTPTFTGFGTVSPSTNICKHRRVGGNLEIACKGTLGTTTASLASMTLPNSLTLDSSRITATNTTANPGQEVGQMLCNQAGSGSYSSVVTATGTSTSLLYFTNVLGASSYLTPANGNAHSASNDFTLRISVPISGWSNASIITGSFSGVPAVPGQSGFIDSFSYSYGTTNATTVCSASPCSYLDQIGTAVSTTTRSGTGGYSSTYAKTYLKLKCVLAYGASGVTNMAVNNSNLSCSNCNSLTWATVNGSGTATDSYGTFYCQGTY